MIRDRATSYDKYVMMCNVKSTQSKTTTKQQMLANKHCGGPDDNVQSDSSLPAGYSSYCGMTNIGWFKQENVQTRTKPTGAKV